MDIINQFQLPPNMPSLSIGQLTLIILASLCSMAIISSLAAFISNAPKSTLVRAFFAVIIHIILTIIVFFVLAYIKKFPNGEVMVIIMLITASIAYSTCFMCSTPKGGQIALIAVGLYFLIYKCVTLYLSSQYPHIYLQYTDIESNLLDQYLLIRS